MGRLIDADVLSKEFDRRCSGDCCNCEEDTNTESGCKIIDEAPTVDAVPVVHGHWEDYLKSGLKYRCSFCKSRFNTAWEYCPHCGAKMDEVTE